MNNRLKAYFGSLLFFVLFFTKTIVMAKPQQIKFTDIEMLTFYKERFTTGRRLSPVPQVNQKRYFIIRYSLKTIFFTNSCIVIQNFHYSVFQIVINSSQTLSNALIRVMMIKMFTGSVKPILISELSFRLSKSAVKAMTMLMILIFL